MPRRKKDYQVNPADYQPLIKSHCVGYNCQNSLPGTYQHYDDHGNFCFQCIKKMNQVTKEEIALLKKQLGLTEGKRLKRGRPKLIGYSDYLKKAKKTDSAYRHYKQVKLEDE